jgi:CRISPR-associated protein Cas2
MIVVVVENVPSRLRGRLAVRLLEVRAGVYVGRASARLRDRIWSEVEAGVGSGNAVMVWSALTEQGYRIRTFGESRRIPVDFDGLILVAFKPVDPDERQASEPA